MRFNFCHLLTAGVVSTLVAAGSAQAGTFVVDGTTENYESLSEAVAAAVSSGPGPHTINITTNTLPVHDLEVVISEPMTINGDADNDGIPCLIVADTDTMTRDTYESPGYPGGGQAPHVKTYIEVNTTGDVTISDLKIVPNSTNGTTINRRRVCAVRMYRPMGETDVANITLNNVRISGSDAEFNYVDLDTDADLFNTVPNRWPLGPSARSSIVMLEQYPTEALGTYNVELNNCHVGLGQSGALSIMNPEGSCTVNGGLYGHCGRDGINVEGPNVNIAGTATDRVRVIHACNLSSYETNFNAHGIRVWTAGVVDLLEYVDVQTTNAGVNFNVNGGTISSMRYCRGLGKPDSYQNTVFFGGSPVVNIEDCTFNGSGSDANPMQAGGGFDGFVSVIDSIFTSENTGLIRNDNSDSTGIMAITYSAIASDGYPDESLADPPTTSPAELMPPTLLLTNNISESPRYMLPASAYDWSDDQGAGQPGNGPGNINVLRPTDAAYVAASSTGEALVGGAGPLPSRVDASLWMLME